VSALLLQLVRSILSHSMSADTKGTQDNCLLSLEHLGPQPDLKVLRAERNIIDDFHGTERCPKLKEVCLPLNLNPKIQILMSI